jgi:nucleotide-binding universal stress UspA family protein
VAARPPRDARHRRARLDTAAEAEILEPAVRGEAAKTAGEATSMIVTRKRAGFRSVLCPVDFSEHSRRALEYGAAIALDAKAALHVMYVTDPLLVAAAAAAFHHRQLTGRSARELQEFVDATLPPPIRKRLAVTARVAVGTPADQILKAAARNGCDLIVVGTRGLNAVNRVIVGSTTLDLLQKSTVPVLAIPRRAKARPLPPRPG